MLNENAKKWVAALRDPEAKQTKQTLEDDTGNCCLGVVCRLYAKEYPDWPIGTREGFMTFGSSNSTAVLPYEVMNWLNLNNSNGRHVNGQTLTRMNDHGASFAEIADLIESEPAGLFVA